MTGHHIRYQGFESFNTFNVHKWLFADPAMYRVIMELHWRCVSWKEVASELVLQHLAKETPDGIPCTYTNVYQAVKQEVRRMRRLG